MRLPRLASGALLKGGALALERGARLLLVLRAAALLGEDSFGRFQYATTLTAVAGLAAELGLTTWSTRALARAPDGDLRALRVGLTLRALGALPYLLVVALACALGAPGEVRAALAGLGLSTLLLGFAEHLGAALRARERFLREALLQSSRAALLAAAGLLALRLTPSLSALCAALALASLLALALSVAALAPLAPLRALLPAPTRAEASEALREALPLGAASLLSTLYFKADTFFLRALAGDAELGLYAAAYKLFEGSMLLPAALLAATFPALARARDHAPAQRLLERRLALALLLSGAAVAALFALGAGPLLALLYGPRYAASAAPLRALGAAVPLLYLNYGLTHFLVARDRARYHLAFAALLVPASALALALLVPRAGGVGAAWATGLVELALTALCLWGLRQPP